MTHNSQSLLHQFQTRTESILQKAIGDWQMCAPGKLSSKPSADKWSAAQCLEHLNCYGHHYLPAIERAIERAKASGATPAEMFQPGWLGAYFTNLMLPQANGQLKSTMKSPKNAIPAPDPDPEATLAEFIEQQERLLKLLGAAQSVNLNRIRIPISLTPWIRLRLGDTFGFLIAHLERHVLQAEKAMQ